MAVLEKEDAFDLVLMDIMMPVMDGYEAIKRIRKQSQWKELDVKRLLALLRLWLYR